MTISQSPASSVLISAPDLIALQASSKPSLVVDCSFDLSRPLAGYESYLSAHISGALYANLDTDLSDKTGDLDAASGGRHPLPSRANVARWLSSIGISPNQQVVVYDRQGGMVAGRLWWMLKWLGHERVAVLDGGFPAWSAAGGQVRQGPEAPLPVSQYSWGLQADSLAPLVNAEIVQTHIGSPSVAILDARAQPRFTGETEPLDPVAGHIPSALNRPFSSNMQADGTFKSPDQLRLEFESLLAGRDPAQTIHHCGSGVSAIPNMLAMFIAGYGMTSLYAGSWSDWCSDPNRPVAQG
jgi:thiosulfate/3-mercaptopyruvate sulfurtransferase